MLRSLVRPDRISSPITRTAAVTVVGPPMLKTSVKRPRGGEIPSALGRRLVIRAARSICVLCEATGGKGTVVATSTTFVHAADKISRRSGQIRLYGPQDFAAMRKAGALTAEALDLIGPLGKPGATTASIDGV